MYYSQLFVVQKHMMVLMRSLCKGSSTSLLPKSDVITLTALLKAAKAPAGCTIAESGTYNVHVLYCRNI